MRGRKAGPVILAASLGVSLMVGGCSSTTSSSSGTSTTSKTSTKPAYCTDRADLSNSIDALTLQNGYKNFTSQLQTVQTDATNLINSAKNDFPAEAQALRSALDNLTAATKALPSNPSASQIAGLAPQTAAVVNSAKSLLNATKSACT